MKSVATFLAPYQKRFERDLEAGLSRLGKKTRLKEACQYALTAGGKRFRPALVYMIADALGKRDTSHPALAVEYFHTASLIADDLPCMDNDDVRRGLPTVHKAYNEETALLASFALIAAGFEEIALGATSDLPPDVLRKAILAAGRTMGILGLIGGQFLDIYPPDSTLSTIEEVIEKKTVALFELSFLLGWLFGGGDVERIAEVQKAAFHFGSAFQIADDMSDREQDAKAKKMVNYAVSFGEAAARTAISQHIASCCALLSDLRLASSPLVALANAIFI